MAQISTLYNLGDVVAVGDYYDQIDCGVIKGITISNEGIVYTIKVGFREEETIKVREKYDGNSYRIVKLLGQLNIE